jgi:hypothetical protein
VLMTAGDLFRQFTTRPSLGPCIDRVKMVAVSEPFGSPGSVKRCTCPIRTTGSPRHLYMAANAATFGVPGRNMTCIWNGGPHWPPHLSVLQPALASSPGTSNRTIAGTIHPSSLRRMGSILALSPSSRAAMIYLHSTDPRQRALADAVYKAARDELRQARKWPPKIEKPAQDNGPSGTEVARDSEQDS